MSTIATNDQHMREFQEKVVAKLRADIGEMLPDAVLTDLAKRAVEEQFFKPIPAVLNHYNQVMKPEQPSWFVQEVAKQSEPLIKAMVTDYVTEHTDEIKQGVAQFLDQQNLLLMAVAAMRQAMFQDISQVAEVVITRMRQNY